MLNIDVIRIVICLSLKEIGSLKGFKVGPAIYDPLCDVDVFSSFELFFFRKLNPTSDHPDVWLEFGQFVSWSFILSIFDYWIYFC